MAAGEHGIQAHYAPHSTTCVDTYMSLASTSNFLKQEIDARLVRHHGLLLNFHAPV
jgi:hypothetical protein